VIYKTKALLSFKPCTKKDKIPRDILITHNSEDALAWFNGAAQRDGSKYGAGGVIRTIDAKVYKWTYNCGSGTNTKVELLNAWETFKLAKTLSISCIKVMGDLKVIIEWLMNKGRLKVVALEGWKIKIKELTKMFRSITYQHIYREFNMEVDKQSKLALELSEGSIFYH
jgi:ribonuclease HI